MADQEAAPLHEDQQKEIDRANAEREQKEQAGPQPLFHHQLGYVVSLSHLHSGWQLSHTGGGRPSKM